MMNKLMNIAMVGGGWMGAAQLRKLVQRDDIRVRFLVQPSQASAEQLLSELRLPLSCWTSDFDRVIADKDVDAVWIVSPNGFHGPQSIAAMGAGKHVFCEKPAAIDYDEYLKQIELERTNPDLVTFVDYILYFDPMEQRLREMVADGAFGELSQVQINYRHPVNIAGNKVWKLKRRTMGDAISMGINHALSVMVWIFEANGARPVSVFANSQNQNVRDFEPDPVWNIQVSFDTGATGFCFGNIDNSNGYDAYHNVHGTRGAFVFDAGQARAAKVRYWSQPVAGGKWVWPLDAARCQAERHTELAWPADSTTPDSGDVIHHQLDSALGHFIDCVQSRRQSPLSFANSAAIAEIGWAAQISAATKQPVSLPLDQKKAAEFFTGVQS